MAVCDIVVPTYRGMKEESRASLIQMIQATQCQCGDHAPWKCKKGKHSLRFPPSVKGASVVHWSRNQTLTVSMYGMNQLPDGRPEPEYFFLMDDDMLCQPGHLARLLSYKLDIVCGIATVRRDPPVPNIRFWNKEKEGYVDPLEWDFDSNKLMEIDGAGAAYMLVHRRVLEKMGEAYRSCYFEREEDKRKVPDDGCGSRACIDAYWDKKEKRRRDLFAGSTAPGGDWKFADGWWFQFLDNIVDSQQGELGEDLGFCWKAKKLGFRIYADPQVLPGHIGDYGFSIMDYRGHVEEEKRQGRWPVAQQENKVGIAVG